METEQSGDPLYTKQVLVCGIILELVSKELNHFGVIAGLFWQIGGVIVVDLCYFALFEDFLL